MSKIKQLRLAQALHNEQACLFIDTNGSFNDWVVTTAFYAAIHFVKYKIFPLTIHEGKIEIIDSFEQYFGKYYNPHDSKHAAILKLVKVECIHISLEYRELKDICWGTRYTDYRVDPDIARRAKEILGVIKTYCNPPKQHNTTA